ncbi:hypothetical protein D3C75_1048470 [compost metagenome]
MLRRLVAVTARIQDFIEPGVEGKGGMPLGKGADERRMQVSRHLQVGGQRSAYA